MAAIASRRLAKELRDLNQTGPPTGCEIISADDFQEWKFQLSVLGESVYQDEKFCVRFQIFEWLSTRITSSYFSCRRWLESSRGHCYSNGHICASILGSDWSPVMTVFSVLISLQSMLASSKKRERPPDNDRYVKHAPKNPKDTRFAYHDDTV